MTTLNCIHELTRSFARFLSFAVRNAAPRHPFNSLNLIKNKGSDHKYEK